MDKYRVVKRIGVGTYGSAYLVADKRFPDQVCVLKKVKVDAPPGSDGMPLDGREQQRAAPETEVAVLMQLDHPLVLRCAACMHLHMLHAQLHAPHA